jgi:hypothetical protein
MPITKQQQIDLTITFKIYKYNHIINNTNKVTTIIDMKKLAKLFKGKCLSEKYVDAYSKLKWECSEGHTWETTPNKIINEYQWCSKCRKKHTSDYRKPSFNELNTIAKQHGGTLVSKEYKNIDTPLKWKCSKGHIFESTLWSIKKHGRWCPKCNLYNKENLSRNIIELFTGKQFSKIKPKWCKNDLTGALLELDGYNKELKLAFEYNGKQHYEYDPVFFHKNMQVFDEQEYRDFIKIKQCHKNNVNLMIIPYIVTSKQLPEYIKDKLHKLKINIKNIDINEELLTNMSTQKGNTFIELCEELKYEILEPYIGNRTKVKLRCSKGHEWDVQPRCIVQGNKCPFCGNRSEQYKTHSK